MACIRENHEIGTTGSALRGAEWPSVAIRATALVRRHMKLLENHPVSAITPHDAGSLLADLLMEDIFAQALCHDMAQGIGASVEPVPTLRDVVGDEGRTWENVVSQMGVIRDAFSKQPPIAVVIINMAYSGKKDGPDIAYGRFSEYKSVLTYGIARIVDAMHVAFESSDEAASSFVFPVRWKPEHVSRVLGQLIQYCSRHEYLGLGSRFIEQGIVYYEAKVGKGISRSDANERIALLDDALRDMRAVEGKVVSARTLESPPAVQNHQDVHERVPAQMDIVEPPRILSGSRVLFEYVLQKGPVNAGDALHIQRNMELAAQARRSITRSRAR